MPAPRALFFSSYLLQEVEPTAEALAHLERAAALAPETSALLLMLARGYLSAGRLADARRLLTGFATLSASGPAGGAAARMVAAIDAGQAGGLAQMFDQAFFPETASQAN